MLADTPEFTSHAQVYFDIIRFLAFTRAVRSAAGHKNAGRSAGPECRRR
jgi:hypothetical protein